MKATKKKKRKSRMEILLYKSNITRKTRTVIIIAINWIILPISMLVDISSVGINIDRLSVFILIYLFINLPLLKWDPTEEWRCY